MNMNINIYQHSKIFISPIKRLEKCGDTFTREITFRDRKNSSYITINFFSENKEDLELVESDDL